MTLNDMYTMNLNEAVLQMNLSDMKVHTDDAGNVKSIELLYKEKQPGKESKPTRTVNSPW